MGIMLSVALASRCEKSRLYGVIVLIISLVRALISSGKWRIIMPIGMPMFVGPFQEKLCVPRMMVLLKKYLWVKRKCCLITQRNWNN